MLCRRNIIWFIPFSIFWGQNVLTQDVCRELPIPPVNSAIRCRAYRSCHATCRTNYEFPNGNTTLTIECHNNTWIPLPSSMKEIPDCKPICRPACQNGGLCVNPNTCYCRHEYSGSLCERRESMCRDFPPVPALSRRSCSSRKCTVQCLDDYLLPDGSRTANINCQNGIWVPENPRWLVVPDCGPVCSPPCRNGGVCWANNACRCFGNFKGPLCEYECQGNMPPVPLNSMLRCSSSGACKATCNSNYTLPNGLTEVNIYCGRNGWQSNSSGVNIPNCEPVCNPDCGNNGECVAPNECLCHESYSGINCQFENKYCDSFPATPNNSFKSCNSRRCVMQCAPGYTFPDGTVSATTTCQNGVWIPSNAAWTAIPNCIYSSRN